MSEFNCKAFALIVPLSEFDENFVELSKSEFRDTIKPLSVVISSPEYKLVYVAFNSTDV